MVENCDGKLRALGIYRATAHFARKMVEKWRHIREETKRKMALLKRKTRFRQIVMAPIFQEMCLNLLGRPVYHHCVAPK